MNYDKATRPELIALLGVQDNKIDELLKQLEEQGIEIVTLKSNLSNQASDTEALTGQNDEITRLNSKIDELENTNKFLTGENDDLKANLEESELLLDELKGQVSQAEQKVEAITGRVSVSYRGKTYFSVIPRFSHNGESYVAEDLKNNPDLVAELIEDNLGVLRLAE